MTEIHAKNGEHCILVPGKNPKKLSDAILYLKNNEERRREIALNGRKLYDNGLSLETTSKQLVECLQDLLTNPT